MDYNYVENLVEQSKLGNSNAKDALVEEFRPLILNLSKKSYINSYEFADIKHECYKTLFKCVNVYNLDKHRFVAYATNAITNSINNLIRVSVRRNSAEGPVALILDDKLDHILYSNLDDVVDIIFTESYRIKLKAAMRNLNFSEQELITYVYFNNYSLKSYAELKGLNYSTVVNRKNYILKKLRKELKLQPNCNYLN